MSILTAILTTTMQLIVIVSVPDFVNYAKHSSESELGLCKRNYTSLSKIKKLKNWNFDTLSRC